MDDDTPPYLETVNEVLEHLSSPSDSEGDLEGAQEVGVHGTTASRDAVSDQLPHDGSKRHPYISNPAANPRSPTPSTNEIDPDTIHKSYIPGSYPGSKVLPGSNMYGGLVAANVFLPQHEMELLRSDRPSIDRHLDQVHDGRNLHTAGFSGGVDVMEGIFRNQELVKSDRTVQSNNSDNFFLSSQNTKPGRLQDGILSRQRNDQRNEANQGMNVPKTRGRPKGSKNRPKFNTNQHASQDIGQTVDLARGRQPRKYGEGVNYNVKLAFKNMRNLSPSDEKFGEYENARSRQFLIENSDPAASSSLQSQGLISEALSRNLQELNTANYDPSMMNGTGGDLYPGVNEDDMILDSLNKHSSAEALVKSDLDGRSANFYHTSSQDTQLHHPPLSQTIKKKRGRPAGSILVNGKLVLPHGYVRDQRTYSSSSSSGLLKPPEAGEKRRVGRPRREDYLGVVEQQQISFLSESESALPANLSVVRKKQRRGPVVKRSFGGALPQPEVDTVRSSQTGFPRFLQLPREVQTKIWKIASEHESELPPAARNHINHLPVKSILGDHMS